MKKRQTLLLAFLALSLSFIFVNLSLARRPIQSGRQLRVDLVVDNITDVESRLAEESSIGDVLTTKRVVGCTSPEKNVSWPLAGNVSSKTSGLSCGLSADSKLASFLKENIVPFLRGYKDECQDLVVYGVAFGSPHVKTMADGAHYLDSESLLKKHGHCFFMFVLEDDLPPSPSMGHFHLVPVPSKVLPYQSLRRNTKLLKYHGHFLFDYASHIVWQDAKFFKDVFVRKQPSDYFAIANQDACVSMMALPLHPYAFGKQVFETVEDGALKYQPQFLHHCHAILDSLTKRSGVTDSVKILMHQCEMYEDYMMEHEFDDRQISTSSFAIKLEHGLVDSALIIWNYGTSECRAFNEQFQCTLSDELQCHSDRDQVSIPFVMRQMGLRLKHEIPNAALDQRQQDTQLVRYHRFADDQDTGVQDTGVSVKITKSSCHWYYRALDDCQKVEDQPSVAVLVAGSTKRLLLNSSRLHLLQPLAQNQDYTVDYYASLMQESGQGYRQGAKYMSHIVGDPIFSKMKSKNLRKTRNRLQEAIEDTGATLRAARIHKYFPIASSPLLEKKNIDCRFPMLDLRPSASNRTAIGNNNMLQLFHALELLWDKELLPFENSIGRRYDYIMIFRDDTLWLDNFDMNALLATNPSADAYILSCDARDPPMHAQEINDHGIIIKREKAEVVGRYFSSLLNADLESCHAAVKETVGVFRGCNSEMILNWILKEQDISVQFAPQSLLPFERSVNVRLESGREQLCFHKSCQSWDAPLKIPMEIADCKEIPDSAFG